MSPGTGPTYGRNRTNRPSSAITSVRSSSAARRSREDFPGVYIEMRPKRRYHGENAISHAIGYVSEISSEELETPRFAEYEQGILVGKVGIERQYEERLQGRRGIRALPI